MLREHPITVRRFKGVGGWRGEALRAESEPLFSHCLMKLDALKKSLLYTAQH